MRPLAVRYALASVVAAVLSLATVLFAVPASAALPAGVVGAFVALSAVRADERLGGFAWREYALRIVLAPVAALIGLGLFALGSGIGAWFAFAVTGAVLVLSVWLRRFGGWWARGGAALSHPFIAVMVVPAAGGGAVGWGALAALVAIGWAAVLSFVAGGVAHRDARIIAPSRRAGLQASDRMAIHLAVALAVSIALGSWLMSQHLAWFALTAYIVTASARGRADAAYTGLLRVVGAGLGTILAALLGAAFAPGDPWDIAMIFAFLAAGAVLRPLGYAWWVMAITGALSLLYDFLGLNRYAELEERVLAIALAGAIAIAAAVLIVPVRSKDVVRRRVGDVLIAARDLLAETDAAALPARERAAHAAFDRLAQVRPSLRFARAVGGWRVPSVVASVALVDDALALREALEARDDPAGIRRRLGELRERARALAE